MKTILLTLALFAMITTSKAADRFDPYRDNTLKAIVAVEGVKNPHRRGKSGELTIYRFLPRTWAQYSEVPMPSASDAEVERVAREHYEWCRQAALRLPLAKRLKTPSLAYTVALLWNAGYGRVESGKLLQRHFDYAARVNNLVYEDSRQ